MFNYKYKKILALINAIRDSSIDAVYNYKHGSCYKFALILRSQFEGEIWYDYKHGHIYFKYLDKYFDIDGMHHKLSSNVMILDHDCGHRPHRWKPFVSLTNLFKILNEYKKKELDNKSYDTVKELTEDKLSKLFSKLHHMYICLDSKDIIK